MAPRFAVPQLVYGHVGRMWWRAYPRVNTLTLHAALASGGGVARERRNRTRLHYATPPVNKGAQRYVRYVGVAPSTDTVRFGLQFPVRFTGFP